MPWIGGPLCNYVPSISAVISDDKEEQWLFPGYSPSLPFPVDVLFPSSVSNHHPDHCLRLLRSIEREFSDESEEINFRPELREVESILWCEKKPSLTLFFQDVAMSTAENRLPASIAICGWVLVFTVSYSGDLGLDSRPDTVALKHFRLLATVLRKLN